jgi:hypothetical protein
MQATDCKLGTGAKTPLILLFAQLVAGRDHKSIKNIAEE